MRRRSISLAAFVVLAACTPPVTPIPPPTGVATLSVAAVENHTGSPLDISGGSYIARYVGIKHRTVPDTVREELRTALKEQGFAVADGGAVPVLKVTLNRFEPDLPQLAYVDTSVVATLTEPDGRETWRSEQTHWLVSTSGSPSLWAAYDTGARRIARSLVEGWAAPAH
jgi:hypothetical protein